MNLFDLHCDTIFELYNKNTDNLCVNFEQIGMFDKYIGCFAIWIPDYLNEDQAFKFLIDAVNFAKSDTKMNKYYKNIKITIEGSKFIGNDLSRINFLKENNIQIVTLTWNGFCRVGDGCEVNPSRGLSEFGKCFVKKLEDNNIIIDVSHSSEKLFYDLCDIATKPFIATHSNSRTICNHVRNLTDDQFRIILSKNGIVGLTLCDKFISDGGNSTLDDLFSHVEHFLSLGGENCLCLGTDFDGSETIKTIDNIAKIDLIYDYLLRKNYSERIINKIFFDNAFSFFHRFE